MKVQVHSVRASAAHATPPIACTPLARILQTHISFIHALHDAHRPDDFAQTNYSHPAALHSTEEA